MLFRSLGTRASVSPQCPVIKDRVNVDYLETDVALLKYDDTEYATRDVTPEDTLLAIEVSDSTLRYDRFTKTVLYAEYGVIEVWIINVNATNSRFTATLAMTGIVSNRLSILAKKLHHSHFQMILWSGGEMLNPTDAILETWNRNTTVVLNILNALPEGGIDARDTNGAWTVVHHLSDMQGANVHWLQKSTPNFAVGLKEIGRAHV